MAAVLLSSGLNPRHSADFVSKKTLSDFADPFGICGILKGGLFEDLMVNYLKTSQEKQQPSSSSSSLLPPTTNQTNDDQEEEEEEEEKEMNAPTGNVLLENGLIPVAVTVFDILSLTTKILKKGCMARAARASACFPILFQPVSWNDECDDAALFLGSAASSSGMGISTNGINYKKGGRVTGGIWSKVKSWMSLPKYLFIDGGMQDPHGLVGIASLSSSSSSEPRRRIVNLVAGSFSTRNTTNPYGDPPGPSEINEQYNTINAGSVLSLSIENAPPCGPDKMHNGPRAVKAAIDAVTAVMDVPMYYGSSSSSEEGENERGGRHDETHYILHVDASAFVPPLHG